MTFNNTIRSKLGLIYPLKLHKIISLLSRNELPSLILLRRINFSSYIFLPSLKSMKINICVKIIGFKNTFHQCNSCMLFLVTSLLPILASPTSDLLASIVLTTHWGKQVGSDSGWWFPFEWVGDLMYSFIILHLPKVRCHSPWF